MFLMKPDIFRTPSNKYDEVSIFRTLKYSIFRFVTLAYSELKTFQILRFSKIQFTQNLGIFTTLVYSNPSILRAQGILRNLSNMYDGLFSTEPYVTQVSPELETYSEPCQISMMENFFHNFV